jgi:sugar lactone lactonase YvrE
LTGDLLGKVHVPASQITSCAFGGDDLMDLYITSARKGLTDDQLADEPGAGGLFKARVDVPGVPAVPFKG